MTEDKIKEKLKEVLPSLNSEFADFATTSKKLSSFQEQERKLRIQVQNSSTIISRLEKEFDAEIAKDDDDGIAKAQTSLKSEKEILAKSESVLNRLRYSDLLDGAEKSERRSRALLMSAFNFSARGVVKEVEEEIVGLLYEAAELVSVGNLAIREFCIENQILPAGNYGIPTLDLQSQAETGLSAEFLRDLAEIRKFCNRILS